MKWKSENSASVNLKKVCSFR